MGEARLGLPVTGAELASRAPRRFGRGERELAISGAEIRLGERGQDARRVSAQGGALSGRAAPRANPASARQAPRT
jgi:hypothetical protein